jgi:hypothetical protein
MRCNAAATQDKVQLPTSTAELPGQDCSETISARPIWDTIVLWPKSTRGGNVITDTDSNIMKEHACFTECLECRRATDEFGEVWSIEIDLIEESYIQAVESRGIDAGHEVLQIFV